MNMLSSSASAPASSKPFAYSDQVSAVMQFTLAITGTDVRAYLFDVGTRRLGLMFGLSVVYCLLLGRNIPYWLTTGGYLVAVMFVFRAGPWWQILLISTGSTAAVAYVFNRVFAIPLP